MAGAAATKGQQNLTRTRPYRGRLGPRACDERGGGCMTHLVWHQGADAAGGPVPFIHKSSQGSGNIRLHSPLQGLHQAAFEVPSSPCPPLPGGCNTTWGNLTQLLVSGAFVQSRLMPRDMGGWMGGGQTWSQYEALTDRRTVQETQTKSL